MNIDVSQAVHSQQAMATMLQELFVQQTEQLKRIILSSEERMLAALRSSGIPSAQSCEPEGGIQATLHDALGSRGRLVDPTDVWCEFGRSNSRLVDRTWSIQTHEHRPSNISSTGLVSLCSGEDYRIDRVNSLLSDDFRSAHRGKLALISARFDGGPVEGKLRTVHHRLRNRGLNVLMVEARGGDNFGDMTANFLRQIDEGGGFLIAACTKHYAEVTASPFSSFEELKFAVNNRVKIIPLRFDAIYPPAPDWGKDHKYDKGGTSRDYIKMAFPSSLAYIDCLKLSASEIADALESRLIQDDVACSFDSRSLRKAVLQSFWNVPEKVLRELAPKGERLNSIENELKTRIHKARYAKVWQEQFDRQRPRWQLVLAPGSRWHVTWCALCALIGVVDGCLVPLAVLVDPTFSLTHFRIMDWCSNIFWTLDIAASFRTALWDDSEQQYVFTPMRIALHYVRTSFSLDLTLLALDWAAFGMKNELIMISAVRAPIGLTKLLRSLSPLGSTRALGTLLDDWMPRVGRVCLKLSLGACGLFWVVHVASCLWYVLGEKSSGWVVEAGLEDASLTTKYFQSLHFALTYFLGASEVYPRTLAERAFVIATAPIALCMAMLCLSYTTAMVLSVQEYERKRFAQLRIVFEYQRTHNVGSSTIQIIVKYLLSNARLQQKQLTVQNLFNLLPDSMKDELLFQTRGATIVRHGFFAFMLENYVTFLRALLLRGFEDEYFHARSVVFYLAEPSSSIRFVVNGVFEYTCGFNPKALLGRSVTEDSLLSKQTEIRRITKAHWIGEPGLWVRWVHAGSLGSLGGGVLIVLEASTLHDAALVYPEVRWLSILYARRFLAKYNEEFEGADDLIGPPTMSALDWSSECAPEFDDELVAV